MMIKPWSVTLGVLFFSSFLFAQRQNGVIEGTIKDSDDHPVPGVTITASSPSWIGENRVSGTYPLPWGFNAGWYFRHESGNPWNAGIDTPDGFRINGDPPGVVRRLPARNLVDLRFEKEFPIYSGQ